LNNGYGTVFLATALNLDELDKMAATTNNNKKVTKARSEPRRVAIGYTDNSLEQLQLQLMG